MAKPNGHSKYKFYVFEKQDPVIAALKAATNADAAAIATASGVSPGAIRRWFDGTTKRPPLATVAAACLSQGLTGYDFQRQRMRRDKR